MVPSVDPVFRALDDAGRRALLDALHQRDGRSLAELCTILPGMTRYGVMNHLRVLEEADLVTTRRAGRRKLHYLNPVPIRRIYERWMAKYAEPTVATLAALTSRREGAGPMDTPSHVYRTFVRCTPKEAWTAIVDPDATERYYYGTRVASDWTPGSRVRYLAPDGSVVADGEVLAVDAPRRLEMTFHPRWSPEIEAEGPARMTWLLEEQRGLTRVTVLQYDLSGVQVEEFARGIPYIVAGMKTLLETGRPLAPSS
jgi:DNA-binding transcriptional ArsR family regulator/uncharacterized protein YndB with AHSA1/START domain